MIASKEQVKDLIPQKKPFVMVDTLLQYSETSLKSNFTVISENLFVQNNYFVESGIIEHMAQSVALHTGYRFFLMQKQAPTGYIGSIKNIEISRLPKTSETLETSILIVQEFMGITLVEIEVRIKQEVIAKGEMKTVLAK